MEIGRIEHVDCGRDLGCGLPIGFRSPHRPNATTRRSSEVPMSPFTAQSDTSDRASDTRAIGHRMAEMARGEGVADQVEGERERVALGVRGEGHRRCRREPGKGARAGRRGNGELHARRLAEGS